MATNESTSELAIQLDRFAERIDPYDYQDQVENTQSNIQQIRDDLAAGNTAPFYDLLDTVIAESSEPAIVDIAKELRSQLDKITPSKQGFSIESPERKNEMADNTTQNPEEALYLLDDSLYLHLQETDGGYDYALAKFSALLADRYIQEKPECGFDEYIETALVKRFPREEPQIVHKTKYLSPSQKGHPPKGKER